MLSLRAHIVVCGALFVALVMVVPIAGALHALGLMKDPAAYRLPAAVILGVLFLAFGFSAIPVMVKLVLAAQPPGVRAALPETAIIWGIWALIAAGLAIAIPAAIADGALGPGPGRAISGLFVGKSQGILQARPGMTVDEMVRGSTLKISPLPNAPVISGDRVFEFRIPGSRLSFPGCRYFYVSTFTHDPSRIEAVNIGTSHGKLTAAERDAADADLRRRLAADGWLTGHEVYRDAQDRQLHGGLAQGPEGRSWLKDGVVLTIESKSVDDVAAGQDPATAPVWIQTISLWSAKDYPGFDRLVFAPPTGP